MNDVASLLLVALGRTTLWLAAAALVTTLVLRVARPSWPAAHRFAWLAVLLVGWSFIRLPLTVPWYEAQQPEPTATVELAPAELFVDRQLPAVDMATTTAEPSDEVQATAPAAITPGPVAQLPVATKRIDWPLVLLSAWALGGAALVVAWAVGYVIFVRSLSARVAVGEVHQAEWHELLAAAGVWREIPLCMTEACGPLLCRLPRGFEIIVPESLWHELTARERTAILRHELAHYQRGDVWTSLVARVLALPHWFNPAAWWAARQFDEAAEWACDRAAAGDDATTDYASALVRLGQVGPRAAFYGTAARGRSLAARIRRVLSGPSTEDSMMKKALFVAIVLGLAAASVVQIELVAQQPTSEEKQPAEEDSTAEKREPVEPMPPPTKHAPVEVEPTAVEYQAAARKMVNEALAAFRANLAAYDSGNATMDSVYDWSLRYMRAAQFAAPNDKVNAVVIREHLVRMLDLQKKISALFKVGARGGDEAQMRAANFYVAEAERWLAEAEARANRGGSAAKREPLADATQIVDLKIKIAEIMGQVRLNQVELRAADESLSSRTLSTIEAARLKAERSKLGAQHQSLTEQLKLHEYKLGLLTSKSVPQQETVQDRSVQTSKPDPAVRGTSGVSKGVRFEDKDFDSWAEELRNELSSERRVKAIRALATFGANGYGPQAAALILEACRALPLRINSGDELADTAVGAFIMIPSQDWLPLVLKSLDSDVPRERLFAVNVLSYASPNRIETAHRLAAMLKDPDAEVRRIVTEQLVSYKPAPPEFVATLREWLASNEAAQVSFAARAACGTIEVGGRTKPNVDTKLLAELMPDLLVALERPDPYGKLVEQAMDRLGADATAILDAAIDSSGATPGPRAKEFLEKPRTKNTKK
jgi:beta-lactamase regulating signal transducer with metallopeptidase domain